MATNTTNFNLSKPDYTDTADIAVINSNMDKVDVSLNGLADAIAIVAKNNTHAAITAGQYVYVHGHGSLAEGLYTAKSNISANATLSTSNLQADGSGGLNALNSKIAMKDVYLEQESAVSHTFTVANNSSNILFMDGNASTRLYAAFVYKASGNITVKPFFENSNFTVTVNGNTLTIESADGTTSFNVYARIIGIRGATIS